MIEPQFQKLGLSCEGDTIRISKAFEGGHDEIHLAYHKPGEKKPLVEGTGFISTIDNAVIDLVKKLGINL